jgi:hypothetical protein
MIPALKNEVAPRLTKYQPSTMFHCTCGKVLALSGRGAHCIRCGRQYTAGGHELVLL